LDGRGTQCRSCPMTAGKVPIRTHAVTELEPRDFDLSAHAGEHQSLFGCYGGHRRQGENRRSRPRRCGALAIQPCLQPIRSSGSSGKGCIVRARAARDQCAHAIQCVRADSNSQHPLASLTWIILSRGSNLVTHIRVRFARWSIQ